MKILMIQCRIHYLKAQVLIKEHYTERILGQKIMGHTKYVPMLAKGNHLAIQGMKQWEEIIMMYQGKVNFFKNHVLQSI